MTTWTASAPVSGMYIVPFVVSTATASGSLATAIEPVTRLVVVEMRVTLDE